MPSDAKKARDAAKKAAAKQQKGNRGKKAEVKEDSPANNAQSNGETRASSANDASLNGDQTEGSFGFHLFHYTVSFRIGAG